jgi:uncharacterized integral membrane protein
MDDERERVGAIEAEPADERTFLGQVRLWGGLIGAALLLLFLLQNLQEAKVNFLWFEWQVRLVFALVGSAVLGAVTSLLVGFIRRRAQRAARNMRAATGDERERKTRR